MAQGSRRRGRVFIYIALILILALALVAILLRNQLGLPNQPATAPTPSEEMVSIVVTTQPVARGTTFTEGVLTTIPYPQKDLVAGTFFTNINDVVGKRAKFDLDARVPLTNSMVVVDTVEGSYAAFEIPKGMVAVSIPIDRLSSISYAPQKGDHVNVITSLLFVDLDTNFQSRLPDHTASVTAAGPSADGATTNLTANVGGVNNDTPSIAGRIELDPTLNQPLFYVPSENQRPRLVSQTLLQDAVVLQVGNFSVNDQSVSSSAQAAPTPAPANGTTATTTTSNLPDVITLIVTPQDAVTLNYMMYSGAQLTLALRGAGDDERVQTEAVTLQYLMDQYNVPVPAKLPYGMEPRVDLLSSPQLGNDVATATPK